MKDTKIKPAIFQNKEPKVFGSLKTANKHKKIIEETWPDIMAILSNEMYSYGLKFIEEYHETNCSFEFNYDEYKALTDNLKTGIFYPSSNSIHLGEAAFCKVADFASLMFHEGIHAIQNHRFASLHIRGVNREYPITVSPSHMIIQSAYLECDAIAKASLLSYLYSFVTVSDKTYIENWLNDKENVWNFLLDISNQVLHSEKYNSYLESLINDGLDYYESLCIWINSENGISPQYCTLEKYDLWEIGNSLGINSLSKNHQDILCHKDLRMNKLQKQRLIEITSSLKIKEDSLPTFSESLQTYKLTRSEFLEIRTSNLKQPLTC